MTDCVLTNTSVKYYRQFEANEQPKQRKSKQSQPRCEQCPDGKPAGEIVCRCLDCRVNLCRMCKSQHMKLPILKGNTSVSLVSLKTHKFQLVAHSFTSMIYSLKIMQTN